MCLRGFRRPLDVPFRKLNWENWKNSGNPNCPEKLIVISIHGHTSSDTLLSWNGPLKTILVVVDLGNRHLTDGQPFRLNEFQHQEAVVLA